MQVELKIPVDDITFFVNRLRRQFFLLSSHQCHSLVTNTHSRTNFMLSSAKFARQSNSVNYRHLRRRSQARNAAYDLNCQASSWFRKVPLITDLFLLAVHNVVEKYASGFLPRRWGNCKIDSLYKVDQS